MTRMGCAGLWVLAVVGVIGGTLEGAECSCMNMSANACRRWGSSGAEFYWITDSNPSSSITLTSSPCECGGSGESGTAYIYAYLNASSGQCDEEWDTPCGSGGDISYGRYAKIKVTGNQKAFQHIFPEGLSFRGCYAYGNPLQYTRISITETNTECDLRLSDSSQVLRIVLNASVAQCGGSYSGSKFTIQVKFYEARNNELTQFSLLDAVSGALTVTNNSATSFNPENFIPDIREGTANGWIEKTTYDLTDETTDNCWKVQYKSIWNCQSITEGIKLIWTSSSDTLIPSSHTVYRLKVPGFKRTMHDLPGYAAQAGWSYVWGTNAGCGVYLGLSIEEYYPIITYNPYGGPLGAKWEPQILWFNQQISYEKMSQGKYEAVKKMLLERVNASNKLEHLDGLVTSAEMACNMVPFFDAAYKACYDKDLSGATKSAAIEGTIYLATYGVGRVFQCVKSCAKAGSVVDDAVKTINPQKVSFTQKSISPSFKNGGTVDDLAKGLKGGNVNPKDVPPIRLFERDGKLYSLDNRRLEAFRQAEMNIPYRMATPDELADEMWKMTTTNNGTSIKIRRTK